MMKIILLPKSKQFNKIIFYISILFYLISYSYSQKNTNDFQVIVYSVPKENPISLAYNHLMDSISEKWNCDSPTLLQLSLKNSKDNSITLSLSNHRGFKYYFKNMQYDSTLVLLKVNETLVFCVPFDKYETKLFDNVVLIDTIQFSSISSFVDATQCNNVFYDGKKAPLIYAIYFSISQNGYLSFESYIDFIESNDYYLYKKKLRKRNHSSLPQKN